MKIWVGVALFCFIVVYSIIQYILNTIIGFVIFPVIPIMIGFIFGYINNIED